MTVAVVVIVVVAAAAVDDAEARADVGIVVAHDLTAVVNYDDLLLFHANQSLVTDSDLVILGMYSS